VKIARATFTIASAALLILGGTSLYAAARHTGKVKDDPTKDAVPDPLAAARAAAGGDAVLDALLTELDRSRAQLKMDQVAAPYYIEYRVNDVEEYQAEAAFGAVRESQRVRYRVLRVVVRIGDYKQDSYYNQGMGETNILPLDDDPIALRHQIWLATDEAYKAAGEAFTEKQAALKQFSADLSPVDDFAKAPIVADVEPTVALKVEDAKWK
jgi:TldD protein